MKDVEMEAVTERIELPDREIVRLCVDLFDYRWRVLTDTVCICLCKSRTGSSAVVSSLGPSRSSLEILVSARARYVHLRLQPSSLFPSLTLSCCLVQLALQIANMIANTAANGSPARREVLYVSGEESVLQIKMRAERLGALSDSLFVGSETNIDHIMRMIEAPRAEEVEEGDATRRATARAPRFDAVVIDSIQTVFADDIPSAAGTVNQVKECTLRLLRLAKLRHLPVLLIGHVTKSGDIAGPKVLEHIVDTVVQLEGDPQSTRRFLRCQKNRFGNTSEVGVFSMTDEGLQPLVNPLMAFVSESSDGEESTAVTVDGSSITIAMEGSRPIPLEIQALANRTQFQHQQRRRSKSRLLARPWRRRALRQAATTARGAREARQGVVLQPQCLRERCRGVHDPGARGRSRARRRARERCHGASRATPSHVPR
ncbi:hypothetical protein PINS_up021547 [Pythium insidiosum]|nr:hypothetical protein PINS_up021547 [Pythium insidiosum]